MPIKVSTDTSVSEAAVEGGNGSAAKIESSTPIYTCPMHPEVQRDHPGNVPSVA